MKSSYLVGVLLVVVSALFYSLQPLFASGLYALGWQPLAVLVLRFGASLALMSLFLTITRRRAFTHFDWRALAFGLCMAGSALGYYTAGQRIGFSLAVMLLFAFPVGVTLYFSARAQQWPARSKLLALSLCVLGTYWVIGGGSGEFDAVGVAAGLGAACCYGTAMVLTDGRDVADPWVDVFWVSAGAVTALGIALWLTATPLPLDYWSLVLGSGLALSATIMATGLLIAGIARIGASDAATLALFEAFFAAAISVWFLGDPATLGLFGGGLMIVAGAVILTRSSQ